MGPKERMSIFRRTVTLYLCSRKAGGEEEGTRGGGNWEARGGEIRKKEK